MKNILNEIKIGLIRGISFVFVIVLTLWVTKATWQSTNPGGVSDSDLYVNGNGNLTATKWNNLVDKTNSGNIPTNAIMAFNTTTCPSGRKPADGTNSTPDLRGKFLRGLNSFDNGTTSASTNSGDTQAGRTLGSFQKDDFKSHNHQYSNNPSGRTLREGGALNSNAEKGKIGYTNYNTTDAGGNETRPRNIAVIFCVKT